MELADPELPPEPHPTDAAATVPPDAASTGPAASSGIVLSRDLFFTDKVRGTAEALGFRMRQASDPVQALELIQQWRPRVVLLDLTASELTTAAALADYQKISGPGTWYIAAGPHVQADALRAAREAGCQIVLPRSKFAAELPALLKRCFRQRADQPEPADPPGGMP